MTAPFPPSLICPVLVGRETQLDMLDRLIDQAGGGRGQTALIMGEAGVGKSRLVAEIRQRVRTRQRGDGSAEPIVLQGRCFEPDRALPYAPLRDLLRTCLAARRQDDDNAHTFVPLPLPLATLLPELPPFSKNRDPLPLLDPQQEHQRIIQAFVQFVTQRRARWLPSRSCCC